MDNIVSNGCLKEQPVLEQKLNHKTDCDSNQDQLYLVSLQDDSQPVVKPTDSSNSLTYNLLNSKHNNYESLSQPIVADVIPAQIVSNISDTLRTSPLSLKQIAASSLKVNQGLEKDLHPQKPPTLVPVPSNIRDQPTTSRSAVIKLWVVAVMTLVLCVGLMVAAHLTHSLTLRVEAFHSLYNVGALAGSLLSIKLCRQPQSLHVTFGWARVEVVSYLVSLIFLSSLCFSVFVEAVQTAAHVEHQDQMHHTVATILLCVVALGVNALVFVLIGGYTQHQGSFLEVRGSGEVFVREQVHQDSLQKGLKTLSARKFKSRDACPGTKTLREGYRDVLRDIAGLLLAILCASVVALSGDSLVSLYIDPALAVLSVVILMWLSYPFGAECGNILLQTIPGHVDVASLPERLQDNFPGVVDIHHLHVWSLRPGTVVATVHVVFASPSVYAANNEPLQDFFRQEGISLVTMQPEFIKKNSNNCSKCHCSDHVLDGNGDACDDHATQNGDAHSHEDHHHEHNHEHHHHEPHLHHEHDHHNHHQRNHHHDNRSQQHHRQHSFKNNNDPKVSDNLQQKYNAVYPESIEKVKSVNTTEKLMPIIEIKPMTNVEEHVLSNNNNNQEITKTSNETDKNSISNKYEYLLNSTELKTSDIILNSNTEVILYDDSYSEINNVEESSEKSPINPNKENKLHEECAIFDDQKLSLVNKDEICSIIEKSEELEKKSSRIEYEAIQSVESTNFQRVPSIKVTFVSNSDGDSKTRFSEEEMDLLSAIMNYEEEYIASYGGPQMIRAARSESDLWKNMSANFIDTNRCRSNSENNAMTENNKPLPSSFSLTQSVEKLSELIIDHAM